MKTAQLAAFSFICLLGVLPVAALAQPFTISPDGKEVADQRTGLIWRRCAEGMVFSGGTCTGTPGTFTHEEAVQRAATQARSSGIAWRLPNMKELGSIIDENSLSPRNNFTTFPAAPSAFFWSATPYVGVYVTSSPAARGVVYRFGNVAVSSRGQNVAVRLVRTAR